MRLPDEPMSRNAGWLLYLDLFQDAEGKFPFSMTGYVAVCQFRAEENNPESALLGTATIEVGTRDAKENFVPDPAGNVLALSLTKSQVAAIPANQAFADVLIGPPGDDPLREAHFRAVIGNGESQWPG